MFGPRRKFSRDAREGVVRGADIPANLVRMAQGLKGRDLLIDKGKGGPRITKDGVTGAKEIEVSTASAD